MVNRSSMVHWSMVRSMVYRSSMVHGSSMVDWSMVYGSSMVNRSSMVHWSMVRSSLMGRSLAVGSGIGIVVSFARVCDIRDIAGVLIVHMVGHRLCATIRE